MSNATPNPGAAPINPGHQGAGQGGGGHALPPAVAGNRSATVLKWLSGLGILSSFFGSYLYSGTSQTVMLNTVVALCLAGSLWILYFVPSKAREFSFPEVGVFLALIMAGYLLGISPPTGDPGRRILVENVVKGAGQIPRPVLGTECTFDSNILKPSSDLGLQGIDLMAAPQGSVDGDVVPDSGLEITSPTKVFLRDRSTRAVSSSITVSPK